MCVFIYLWRVAASAGFSKMDEAWNWKDWGGTGGYNGLRLFRLHGHYGTPLHTAGMGRGDDHCNWTYQFDHDTGAVGSAK